MRRTRIALLPALLVIFTLLGGGMAQANHWWNGYKWATRDGVVDLYADLSHVRGEWARVALPVVGDWDRSPRIALDTFQAGKQGAVTVESGNFGASGWLGVAIVRLDSRQRIVGGRVRLNEWYWATGRVQGLAARRHVLCQEFGHVLGLDHQLAQSCMNDHPTALGDWVTPSLHDYEQLEYIYSRVDGYDSGTLAASSAAASPARAGIWRVVHAFPAPDGRAGH
ncbi:MAG: hypothetical protein ABR592_05870 [Nitriliruptorales bacterium]